MIFGIIIIVALVLILGFILLESQGTFGLYTDVDIDRKAIYCWYEGRIVSSSYFSLDDDVETIMKRKEQAIKEAKIHIEKVKKLKEKL